MNVARSTFVRRGYLLTALAVAVLLAASSGTAWAQTIGFQQSRATLEEGASTDAATAVPLKVTISRSGNFDKPDGDDEGTAPDATFATFITNTADHLALEVVEYDGMSSPSTVPFRVTARSGDSASEAVTLGTTASFGFRADASRTTDMVATTIELTIENVTGDASDPDDGDWNPETLVLRLHAADAFNTHLTSNDAGATPRNVRFGTRQLTVTVEDDDPMPKLKFSPPGIQLAAGNMLTMTAGVGIGAGGRGALPSGTESIRATLNGLATPGEDDILLSVSPPEAVGSIIKIYEGTTEPAGGTDLNLDRGGRYIIGQIGRGSGNSNADGAVGDDDVAANNGIELTIKAIDVPGFRDEQITFTLMEGRTEAQKMGDGGAIDDSDSATVTVLSGEETPTVAFSTDAVTIDEGGMETVHLLADGDQGDQVGSVAVSVHGVVHWRRSLRCIAPADCV